MRLWVARHTFLSFFFGGVTKHTVNLLAMPSPAQLCLVIASKRYKLADWYLFSFHFVLSVLHT